MGVNLQFLFVWKFANDVFDSDGGSDDNEAEEEGGRGEKGEAGGQGECVETEGREE